MPFAIYLPFYPGYEPNMIFSREAEIENYDAYLALAERTLSAPVFDSSFAPGVPIVDAGCGGGRWLVRLRRAGHQVFGLDVYPPALERLRGVIGAAALVCGAVNQLPFRSASLGGMISLGVIEHAPEGPAAALAEAARVLRPGGRLLVSVPYTNLLRRLYFHPRLGRTNTSRVGKGFYFVEYRFSAAELTTALRQAGLRPLSVHPHDYAAPYNMSLVADRNMLATRFRRVGERIELDLPPPPTWKLSGWLARFVALAQRISPWITAAEILIVAEKPADAPASQRAF